MVANNLEQLINAPTHLPRENIATCIDLILTDQPLSFVDSGVIPSPDPKCKHQIVHGMLNFNIPSPPKYKRKVWDYQKGDFRNLRGDLSKIKWNELFANRTVDEMTECFTTTFLYLVGKHVPSKIITVNDKDAPWVTPEVKTAIKRNKRVFNKWNTLGRNTEERANVLKIQKDTKHFIQDAKQIYVEKLSRKLCDPRSGQKEFWNAFKRLVKNKKNTNIPPIKENGTFVTSFKLKAGIFNRYFSEQCRSIESNIVLPPLNRKTDSSIQSIPVSVEKIESIISKLNPKKAHGFDGISIPMLKMCISEVSIPLQHIFNKCLRDGVFPAKWKHANVQPVHKKSSRQLKENYRPISLLPICSKIFEKVIFDSLYSFLTANNLISQNQSGFRPGDSTINQLLAITTEIYEAFEDYDEVRAVFLDISKAFDKVWHDGLIFKLKQNGINGELLRFFENYLHGRKQRVVLNGVESVWEPIESGVPQGSVLGPLLFLVYINDLSDNIKSNMKLFADDSSLFLRVKDINLAHEQLLQDLNEITKWANQWKMRFNPDITKQAIEVIFSYKYKKENHPPLLFNNIPVARRESTKHLGIILDERLTFRKHIKEAILKANSGIALLKFLSRYVTRPVLDKTYKMYVRPHLEYGDCIFHNQLIDAMKSLESVQYQAALIVSGCWQGTSREKLYNELGWESLADRRIYRRFALFYKIKASESPSYLANYIQPIPARRTIRYERSFFPFCQLGWDDLDENLRQANSLEEFKRLFVKQIRPPQKGFSLLDNRYGLKRLTQLRVGFSDLRQHRFDHNFNCPSPICKCGLEEETNEHYFLRCHFYTVERIALLGSLSDIVKNDMSCLPYSHLCDIILYGSKVYNDVSNKMILQSSIHFIKSSKRFDVLEAYNQ